MAHLTGAWLQPTTSNRNALQSARQHESGMCGRTVRHSLDKRTHRFVGLLWFRDPDGNILSIHSQTET